MLPLQQAYEVKEAIYEFIQTSYRFKDQDVNKAFNNFIRDKKHGLIKGPYISLKAPFVSAPEGYDIPLDIAPGFPPYKHQIEAFKQLTTKDGHKPQNTLITTGTGSGKTECFLYPILDYCYKNIGRKGIKVIILYPMNALATDQARRLAQAIYADERLRGQVTAGLFIGKGQDKKEFRTAMEEDGIIESRETILASPPDILLTNFKMLDMGIMKAEFNNLWSYNTNDPDVLQFLVLDELHTYDGAQGTDVANLIRRLKLRLGKGKGTLCGVGTSATIGTGKESKELLCSYASEVYGEDFDTEHVIEEHRVPSAELFEGASDPFLPSTSFMDRLTMKENETHESYIANQKKIWMFDFDPEYYKEEIESVALTKHLSGYQITRDLFSITEEKGIVDCESLIEKLCERNESFSRYEEKHRVVILGSLLALIAEAKVRSGKIIIPFLPLQVQLWIRELSGIRRVVSSEPKFTWKSDTTTIDEHVVALPMYYCRECGASGWVANKGTMQESFGQSGSTAAMMFMSRDGKSWLLNTDTEGHTPDESFESIKGKLKPDTLKILPSAAEDEGALDFVACQKKEHENNRTTHWCPECNTTKDDLAIVGAKSATLTSLAVGQILSSNLDNATDKNRKILTFTNGVQDAAHLSSFIVARNYRFTLRASIQKVIEILEKEGKKPSLVDVYERFTDYWKKECETTKAYLYRFFPPDYEGKIDLKKDYIDIHGNYKESFLKEFDLRLFWEIVSEFGYSSAVGRSLELTGSSVAYFKKEDFDAVYHLMKPWFEENNLQFISTEDFGRFLSGFLLRMRQHGGIDHPYLGKFRRDLRLWDLNWQKDNTHFLNRMFGPGNRRLKAFITFSATTDDTRQNADSSFTNRNNWYFDYFKKCFPLAAAYNLLSNEFYRTLAEKMTEYGLLSAFSGSAGDNYMIDPSKIYLTSDARLVKCDKCQSTFYTSIDDAYASESICIINRCTGAYTIEEKISSNYYQQIYRRERTPRIYSHEHTGLLDRKLRESIETDFKERPEVNSINSLVATSTLEMGIDIGDLNAEINVSLPPLTSNYLQRVGRAGRKSGAALIVDFAKSDPHDLFFFEDPQEMMSGKVNTPGCFLNAKDILKRHFYAYCIDCWTKEDPESNKIPLIIQLLRPQTDFIPSATFFVNRLSSFIADHFEELTEAFSRQYDDETVESVLNPMYELFKNDTFSSQVITTFRRLKTYHDELLSKLTAIKAEIKERNLSDNDPTCKSLKEQRKLLGSQLRKLRKRQVLEFMTDEGILPNYAFPETGVTLNASILGNIPKGEDTKVPDISSLELVRPATSGIVDLAPGNFFYFDGMKIKVDGLNTAEWQSGKGLIKKRFCSECDCIIDDSPSHPAMCPKCGDPHFGSSDHVHLFVDLHEVKSNVWKKDAIIDDSSDDRTRKTYCKSFHLMFDAATTSAAYGMKDIPFGIEYVKNVRIFEANLGEGLNDARSVEIKKTKVPSHGFVTCKYCGKSTSDPDAILRKQKVEDRKREWHYGYCKHRDKEYTGVPDEVFEEVFLSREIQTEAIKILLPVQQIDSIATTAMFIAGLNLGLKYYFKGNPQHIRMRDYAEYNDITGRFDNYVVLYDTIPGGTGYLAKLFDTIEFTKLLTLAYEHIAGCSCKDEGKDGCYHCILSYENQFARTELSRQKAEALFKRIVDESDEWEVFTGSLGTVSGEGGIEESELEDKFISTLREISPARGWHFTNRTDATYRYYQLDLECSNKEHRTYLIHPQRELGPAVDVEFNTRPDFLITCTARELSGEKLDTSDILPIAIYLDGYTYHGNVSGGKVPRFFDDYKKRDAIHRSRRYISWTLSWEDLDLFANNATDSVFAPAHERIAYIWDKTDLRKYVNNLERLIYVLCSIGTGPHFMQHILLYFVAWSEGMKYSNTTEYLSFTSDGIPSTDGSGFFKCKAGIDSEWASLRIVLHDNKLKYAVKLKPIEEDLDRVMWNHFWRLYNLLNLSPEPDYYYPEHTEDETEDDNIEVVSENAGIEASNKHNTLYLSIKQEEFDQIVSGTKDKEYREIKEGITANRYLLKADNESGYSLNPECTDPSKKYYIDDYNEGKFPFLPKPIKFLSLAVGYNKERDTALVEVTGISFEPNTTKSDLYAYWTIAYHLGRVLDLNRNNSLHGGEI